jgi:hypothetical protein
VSTATLSAHSTARRLLRFASEASTFPTRRPAIPCETMSFFLQYHDAVSGALEARRHWENLRLEDRVAIALKAADIISGPRRAQICAATMLGTGKNMWQAEIDAGTELPDFLRFGSKYAAAVHAQQPADHSAGVWNRLEYRGLEGFVAAISPFNFLAIGCNLVRSPVSRIVVAPYRVLTRSHTVLLLTKRRSWPLRSWAMLSCGSQAIQPYLAATACIMLFNSIVLFFCVALSSFCFCGST